MASTMAIRSPWFIDYIIDGLGTHYLGEWRCRYRIAQLPANVDDFMENPVEQVLHTHLPELVPLISTALR